MEQLGSSWKHFHGILYLIIFRKSVEKVQVALKSDNNNGDFTLRPIGIFIASRWILLTMEMLQTRIVVTHITYFVLNKGFSKILPFMR